MWASSPTQVKLVFVGDDDHIIPKANNIVSDNNNQADYF